MIPFLTLILLFGFRFEYSASTVQTLNGCGAVCGKASPPFRSSAPKASRVEEEDYYPDYEAEPDEEESGKKKKSKGKIIFST